MQTVRGVLVALALCATASSALAGRIGIDLTQVGTETNSNIANDTWRWNNVNGLSFDLEFSSGNGSHIDLDGGATQGNEYYTGLEAATNHTYDLLWATYLGGNTWRIEAERNGVTTFLGNVTEYAGALTHAANYSYSASESHIVNGPSDAGANSSDPTRYKAWFWIYRDTVNDTISLNIISGSGATSTPNDGGDFRAEFLFEGSFTGTPEVLVGNEPGEITKDLVNLNLFRGNWGWDGAHDDGASLGGITPFAHVVPLPAAVWAGLTMLGGLGLLRRRRQRRAL